MRQYLNSSLESHSDSPYGKVVLSMEEEQQLLTEAAQDEASVSADLSEVARMNDISEAIEDLAVIADGIEDPTDAEAALVDNVAQMAVTGTEVAPEEIVPAMESHNGKMRISTEGLRETARSIWEAIKRVLKKIWEKIESFFYKIFGTIPGLRRTIKALKLKVDDNNGAPSTKKISVSVGVQALSVNYSTPKSEGDLKAAMKTLTEVNDKIYGAVATKMQAMGETIVDGMNDFDPEKPEDSLPTFVSKLATKEGDLTNMFSGGDGSSNRWPGFNVVMSKALPGNVSIATRIPKEIRDLGKGASIQSLETLRKLSIEVVQTSEKSKDVPNSFEMSTLGNGAMSDLLDDADKLLDTLEKFQRGKNFADMKKIRGKLETASAKANTAMSKADGKEDDAQAKTSVPYYRALLNFNTAFARWSKDPAMPMVTHSLAFVRGVVTCVQKSLSDYK